MLLCVHVSNGARHLIEASRVLYDKEYDCIWIDEGSIDYQPWIYDDDYDDKKGIYIDNTTLKEYQIRVTKSYGAKFSSITAGNISDIYNRIEQELFEHDKVYIEMHKLTK